MKHPWQPGPRLLELSLSTDGTPHAGHLIIMTLDGVAQCLDCGLWTTGPKALLEARTCVPDSDDDPETPLELLEVTE